MTDYKYDKCNSVKIGRTSADCVTITNVLYWAPKVIAVEGDMVSPLAVINDYNPSGVHQSHKYLEMEMALDTDWLTDSTDRTKRWAYTQKVDAADTKPAIDEDGYNTAIEYLVVSVREHDGTETTLTYANEAANTVWCTGEISDFSNEEGTRHQTVTFKFICLGEEVRS